MENPRRHAARRFAGFICGDGEVDKWVTPQHSGQLRAHGDGRKGGSRSSRLCGRDDGQPQPLVRVSSSLSSSIRRVPSSLSSSIRRVPSSLSSSFRWENQPIESPNHSERIFQAQVSSLRDEVVNYQNLYAEMKRRAEMAERALQNHSLVDTGFYRTEATPALLEQRSNNVKFDAQKCATAISVFADKNNLTIRFDFHADTSCSRYLSSLEGPRKLQFERLALESIICEDFFKVFESSSYGVAAEPFDKPENQRRRRLKSFHQFVNAEPTSMIDESQEFKQFAEKKLRRLKKSLKKIFNHPANFPPAFQRGEEEGAKFLRAIVRRLSDAQNNHFYLSFLRLAKAVWLLHKIAFSCEPASAELLRVPAGAHFSAEFMKEQEDLQRSLDAIHQDLHEKRVVAFMLVPGFTLRNSIIKAYVCCVDSFC